jgi:hypothetical protein
MKSVFKQTLDLLFSITTLGIIVAILIPILLQCKYKAYVIAAISSNDQLKMQSVVDYNLTGIWPKDESSFNKTNPAAEIELQKEEVYFVRFAHIEQGALQITFNSPFPGKTLTVRPAVPEDDPMGPVIWIAGNLKKNEGWLPAGTDRTDIPVETINDVLK